MKASQYKLNGTSNWALIGVELKCCDEVVLKDRRPSDVMMMNRRARGGAGIDRDTRDVQTMSTFGWLAGRLRLVAALRRSEAAKAAE